MTTLSAEVAASVEKVNATNGPLADYRFVVSELSSRLPKLSPHEQEEHIRALPVPIRLRVADMIDDDMMMPIYWSVFTVFFVVFVAILPYAMVFALCEKLAFSSMTGQIIAGTCAVVADGYMLLHIKRWYARKIFTKKLLEDIKS